MSLILALTHRTGVRLAEIGFLLILLAGVWLVLVELLGDQLQRTKLIVAGLGLAGAGVLLIIAAHWGHLFP
jgi:hypothetical protein